MHPNRAFAWDDREAALALVAEVAFCTICVDGPFVAHAPVVVAAPDRLRFHLARSNRAMAAMEGARAVISCLGPDAYISPDWYGTLDQVGTWNYLSIEAEGPLRRLDEAELVRLLDELSAIHEARLAPKPPWTRAKMSPGRFEGMVKAIVGFEMAIEELRGTRKLGQHKAAGEREGAVAGLAAFNPELAALMSQSSPSLLGEGDRSAKPSGGGAERSEENGSGFASAAPPPRFARSPSPSKLGEDL